MDRSEFCARVLARVRHATPEEKAAIQAELEGHLEDHAAALEEAGYGGEEAQERALASMGDPEEIGGELNRQYPLGWLLLSRAALILTVLLCASFLFSWPLLGNTLHSLQARLAPERSGFVSQGLTGGSTAVWPTDLRATVGNDVVRVYQVALTPWPDKETGRVDLYICNYDRNPFGAASGALLNRMDFETSLTEENGFYSGGGGGSAGAYYFTFEDIPVSRTDEFVAVTYDGFGSHMRLEVPLDWGAVE